MVNCCRMSIYASVAKFYGNFCHKIPLVQLLDSVGELKPYIRHEVLFTKPDISVLESSLPWFLVN